MLYLSDLLITHPDLESFDALCEVIREQARQGERFLHFNVKPPFPDTPENWEDRLEAVFSGRL